MIEEMIERENAEIKDMSNKRIPIERKDLDEKD